jgi:beta-phosphoglucomutase-like phosphatase (HAD superfamily)
MSDETLVQEPETAAKRVCGLIVDFDYALIDGIGTLEKTCVKAFGAAGVNLDQATFARRVFGQKAVQSVNALLGSGAEAHAESVLSGIASEMDKAVEKASPNAAIVAICKQTAEEGGQVIFVTSRSVSVVEQKLGAIGLENSLVFKADRCDRFGEYPLDTWPRAARMLRLNPRYCTAIAASAMSARQSVVAGMRTAVFTHPLISFQDFSGVDVSADGHDAETLLGMVMELVNSRLN